MGGKPQPLNMADDANLLTITAYGNTPMKRLLLQRNGTYVWQNFQIESSTWQTLFAGILEKSDLTEIEIQLRKASKELRFKRYMYVKDEYGNDVKLESFRVISKDGGYVFDYFSFDSFTKYPDVIMKVYDKCDYAKVLDLSGFKIR